jgi:hypothetical protein
MGMIAPLVGASARGKKGGNFMTLEKSAVSAQILREI